MPDLAMCQGDGCSQKIACYRYRAVPTPLRQSYFVKPPVRTDGTCDYFTELMKSDVVTEISHADQTPSGDQP
jgi:hypothetical protein